MFSNMTGLIKAIEYLEEVDTTNMNEDKEYAIERCFEIIGGALKEMVKSGEVKETENVNNWIRTRDKISHFYHGIVHSLLIESISTLRELRKDIKK